MSILIGATLFDLGTIFINPQKEVITISSPIAFIDTSLGTSNNPVSAVPEYRTTLNVLSLDPSMNNLGLVTSEVWVYFMKGDTEPWIVFNTEPWIESNLGGASGDVLTYKAPDKKHKRKVLEHVDRAKQHLNGLAPYVAKADYVFAEAPHGSQSYSAAVSYGLCVGFLGNVLYQGKPLQLLTPQEARKSVFSPEAYAQITEASKDSYTNKTVIIEKTKEIFGRFRWPMRKVKGESVINQSKAEHIADALVTLLAGLRSKEFGDYVKTARLLNLS